jgi:hypothetical protein
MENYVVCEKRANQSRIHVRICQDRCKNAETCQAFRDYMVTHPGEKMVRSSDGLSWSQENLFSSTPA